MNHSKDEEIHIEMSSHQDIVHQAVKIANVPAEEVNSTKKKWETMMHSVAVWNKISVIACMIAVSVDPLFFYIPFVDHTKVCLGKEKRLMTAVLITRSLTDFTFLFHIVHHIREAMKSVASVSNPKLVQPGNSKFLNWFGPVLAIAKKLSWSSFLTDVFAVIPIPHLLILVWLYDPDYRFSETKMTLNYVLLAQYVPRMYRIFISSELLRKTSSMWLKAAFYFFMYILSSHVIGAFWHFSSVQIEEVCWNWILPGRFPFKCDALSIDDREVIREACNGTGVLFDYGSFRTTVEAGYTGPKRFREKLVNFVWWGLKNLSTYGTDIDTSNSIIWEKFFAILVSCIGLVLFALLIGNMQQCMQSSEEKKSATDKVQMKEIELQEWMDKNRLPEKLGKDAEKLRIEIMKKIRENLKDEKSAEVENLFSLLPWNTMKDLKLGICMNMLKKVGRLENMDERGLRLICQYLKPVTYTEKTIAFRMGEPLDSVLFIMEGVMLRYPTNIASTDHKVGGSNIDSPLTISGSLEDGDVYGGEQLLSWASPPDMSNVSYGDLPILAENVKCLSEVEGFLLTAKDLKNVISVYKLQGNYNSTSHTRGTSTIRRNRINFTIPGIDGRDEEAGNQESLD